MKESRIPIRRSARYYSLGEANDQTRALWIVCHGYGQLAGEFIQAFKALDDGHTCIVAPEALSRFYLDGFSGEVGASWMTREDRVAEIADQKNYLDALYRIVTHPLPSQTMINILGFSQGTATVARWLSESKYPIDNLILWAGEFPRDLNSYSRFEQLNTYYVYGNQDPFLNPQRIDAQAQKLQQAGLHFQQIQFDGKHHLHSQTLLQLQKNMRAAQRTENNA
jgi:predicted esterase